MNECLYMARIYNLLTRRALLCFVTQPQKAPRDPAGRGPGAAPLSRESRLAQASIEELRASIRKSLGLGTGKNARKVHVIHTHARATRTHTHTPTTHTPHTSDRSNKIRRRQRQCSPKPRYHTTIPPSPPQDITTTLRSDPRPHVTRGACSRAGWRPPPSDAPTPPPPRSAHLEHGRSRGRSRGRWACGR